MALRIFTSILTFLPLIIVFVVLWNQRKRFHSLSPFVWGVAFLTLARILDVPTEFPNLPVSDWFGTDLETFNFFLTVTGDSADAFGVALLVLGFVRTIQFIRAEEKTIEELETLLPICANCKKYRIENGTWLPIERYLILSGAPKLTHGICPDCAEKMRQEMNKLKS